MTDREPMRAFAEDVARLKRADESFRPDPDDDREVLNGLIARARQLVGPRRGEVA